MFGSIMKSVTVFLAFTTGFSQMLGGTKEVGGCYSGAGYEWCEAMNKCVELNKHNGLKNSQKICLDKYKVNQIVSSPNYLLENNAFICKEIKLLNSSRNPFNRNIQKKSYCVRKRLIE